MKGTDALRSVSSWEKVFESESYLQDTPLARHQFPRSCSGRFTVLHDDLHGAGLGFTAKLMSFALILSAKSGRVLVEGRSLRRWCTKEPGTLQCYYRPWTNCSLEHATSVQNLSLASFHRRGRWYGMSSRTKEEQAHAVQVLFRARAPVLTLASAVVAQCGGANYWTVHLRDSPEKRKERGALPPLRAYLSKIPPHAKILWQTSNPRLFEEALSFSRAHSVRYCHTNYSRHVNDAWGGRNTSMIDEAGITGAVNGALGRVGVGCISAKSSSWTWFLLVGTHQDAVLL